MARGLHEHDDSFWSDLIEGFRSQKRMELNALLCMHIGVGARYLGTEDLIDFASTAATVGNLNALRPILLHCNSFQPDDWGNLISACTKALKYRPETQSTFLKLIRAVSRLDSSDMLILAVMCECSEAYDGVAFLVKKDPEWKIAWTNVLHAITSLRGSDKSHEILILHFRLAILLEFHLTPESFEEAFDYAIKSNHSNDIREIYEVLRRSGGILAGTTWGKLATKAKDSQASGLVAQALWDASESSSLPLDDSTLLLFKALGESCAVIPRYLGRLRGESQKNAVPYLEPPSKPKLSPKITKGFSNILTGMLSDNPAFVFETLHQSPKPAKFWSAVSAEFKEILEESPEQTRNPIKREICNMLFNFWEPEPSAFIKEQAIWINLLIAADLLRDEVLIHKITLRLFWLYDPTRHPNLGQLQQILWRMRNKMEQEELATEIEHLLNGNHWEIAGFFRVLQAWPPRSMRAADTRFGGAGRCLNKWIINQYFSAGAEFHLVLREWIKGLKELPDDIRREAWVAVLSQGWQNVGGNILGCCRDLLSSHVTVYLRLEKDEFLKKVADGSITQSIVTLLKDYVTFSPIPYHADSSVLSKPEYTALLRRMAPLVESIRMPVVASASDTPLDKEISTKCREDAVASCQPDALGEEEGVQFMMILLKDISNSVLPAVKKYATGLIHDMKRNFHEDIAVPLGELDLTGAERHTLYLAARTRLERPGLVLESRRRRTDAGQPVNLGRAVKRFRAKLINAGYETEWTDTGDLLVAGFHGAREHLDSRIFEEIIRNIRNACTTGKVTIHLKIDGKGAAVLTIKNPSGNGIRDRFSTKLGLETLKDRMSQFQSGKVAGHAEFEDKTITEGTFLTRLVFPQGMPTDN